VDVITADEILRH